MSDILVAYFSATGATKKAAEAIAKESGGDLFEIEAQQAYTREDLDWTDTDSRTTKEKNDPSLRPAIRETVKNLAQYKTIFLGFPIWWYREPNIIHTFLESGDFTGKKIILFATSGGSGLEGTAVNCRVSAPGAQFVEGKRVSSSLDAALFARKALKGN